MRGLSLSGGSTKISAIAGAAVTACVNYNFEPNYITGISAGAIISLPLALGMYDEVEYWAKNFEPGDVFSEKPYALEETNWAKTKTAFKSIIQIIKGSPSLGKQDALNKTLMKIVSPELFEEYKKNNRYPTVFVGAVEYKTGKKQYFNIKNSTYEQWLEYTNASASIPIFVEARKFDNGYWYDGGMRDHLGSHWLMENYNLTEHISIYSRAKDYDIAIGEWEPGNILKVLMRTIDILNMEKSKNDEWKENTLSESKNIKNTQIFLPIVTESTYEWSPELMIEWYQLGVEQAKIALEK